MAKRDPITVQILRNRASGLIVSSIMAEMDYRFYRSGHAKIVRESPNFSCIVADRAGPRAEPRRGILFAAR